MPILEFGLFVALGAACGFIGGLFGVGGAMIMIPILGIFFGFSEQLAQGTALVLVFPNLLLSLWRYFRRGSLDVRAGTIMAAAAIPTTLAAAWLATIVASRHLRFAYALFLLVMILEYARRSFLSKRPTLRLPPGTLWVVGAVAGLLVGFFTVGGTLFTISATTFLYSLTQLQAQGLALAFSAPATLLSLVVYSRGGDVDWAVGVPLAIGGLATISAAVDVAHRLPERWLRLLYVAFMGVAAVSLLLKAARSG